MAGGGCAAGNRNEDPLPVGRRAGESDRKRASNSAADPPNIAIRVANGTGTPQTDFLPSGYSRLVRRSEEATTSNAAFQDR